MLPPFPAAWHAGIVATREYRIAGGMSQDLSNPADPRLRRTVETVARAALTSARMPLGSRRW